MLSMVSGGSMTTLTSVYASVKELVTWRSLMIYGSLFLLSYLTYHIFIQPFLSPIRKVPGLQYIPFVGNMRALVRGEAMESSIRWMNEYGTVMRYYFMFGVERLMITDPQVMKHILLTNSRNYVKPRVRLKLLKEVIGEGLIMSEGNKHAAHKRLMSPSFNRASIKTMLPVFDEVGQVLADVWKTQIGDQASADIAVQADLCKTTLDIVGKTAFGHEFNSLKNSNTALVQAFQQILTGGGLNWRMFIPFYYKLPLPDSMQFRENLRIMRNTVDGIISQKRKQIEKGQDLESVAGDVLGMMMMARDEVTGHGMTDIELRDEVMTIMLAGHETTAAAMAWLLLMLAQHQDLQERARQEVLNVCHDPCRPITWQHLEQLEFCERFMKETLRMYPTVPITLRQALNADVYQNQYQVPKGTILMLAMGPMMRNEEFFPDADTFKPDRFLEQDAKVLLYSFMPFLVGRRMCLGYKFALAEIKLLMTILLRKFRFESIPGQTYKRQLRITMRPEPPLQLRVSNYSA